MDPFYFAHEEEVSEVQYGNIQNGTEYQNKPDEGKLIYLYLTIIIIGIVVYLSEMNTTVERKRKNRESAIKSRKKKREIMENLQSDWNRLTKVGIYIQNYWSKNYLINPHFEENEKVESEINQLRKTKCTLRAVQSEHQKICNRMNVFVSSTNTLYFNQ